MAWEELYENDKNRIKSDVLEWSIPEEVLSVLLKGRSTGRNIDRGKEAS